MTTPVAVQPIVSAVKTAVESRGVLFGDGGKPANVGTKPWIVAWPDGGTYSSRSLRGGDGWSMVLTAHCVGLTPESARIAAAKLSGALYSLFLTTVDGRQVQFPEQLSALPLQRDDDSDPPLFVQIVEWRLRTSPA